MNIEIDYETVDHIIVEGLKEWYEDAEHFHKIFKSDPDAKQVKKAILRVLQYGMNHEEFLAWKESIDAKQAS